MSVSTQIDLYLKTVDDGDKTAPTYGALSGIIDWKTKWADGTSTNQADVAFFKKYALSASGTQVLDLAGSLTDDFGRTVTFAKIRAICFENTSTTSGDTVTVGPDATNGITTIITGTTPKVDIDPGGVVLLTSPVDGWSVTGGSADEIILTETGGANTVTVRVLIVGTSA